MDFDKLPEGLADLFPCSPWQIKLEELEALAARISQSSKRPLVRTDGHSALIIKWKNGAIFDRSRGALSARLNDEIELLNQQIQLLIEGQSHPLEVITFFHLRFAHIHPLRDGNGRVSRVYFSLQCERVFHFPVNQTLRTFQESSNPFYYYIFAQDVKFQYELMYDFFLRTFAIDAPATASPARFPITAHYPDTTPIDHSINIAPPANA